jgi:hypothetical protein
VDIYLFPKEKGNMLVVFLRGEGKDGKVEGRRMDGGRKEREGNELPCSNSLIIVHIHPRLLVLAD